MTLTADITPIAQLTDVQHLVLDGVSWAYYEHTLEQIGNRPLRVTYCDGKIEIMSPLPEHEAAKKAYGRLVETLTLEFGLPVKSYGSTTFRREDSDVGLEPDECFYIENYASVLDMKRFDPLFHSAPDLAIEIDILSPSIAREPIYARLGVPELWRYNGQRLAVRILTSDRTYLDAPASRIFPSLPMSQLPAFVERMVAGEQNQVMREFQAWVRGLKR